MSLSTFQSQHVQTYIMHMYILCNISECWKDGNLQLVKTCTDAASFLKMIRRLIHEQNFFLPHYEIKVNYTIS